MHPNNPHKHGYDIQALAKALPELVPCVIENKHGKPSIDFSDAQAVKLLNRALLKQHGVQFWDIPDGFLCPPIPGRLDYLYYLNDELKQRQPKQNASYKVQALDVGTGANMVYALLASQVFNWKVTGSDIETTSIEWGQLLLQQNKSIKKSITLKKQNQKQHIFKGIIKDGDYFDVTLCNPPFHASEQEAAAGSVRKNKNLNRNKQKRGSNVKAIANHDQLNFAGQHNELWCKGGELAFIKNMINESMSFSKQVGMFSCLVSKKESLAPLKKQLEGIKHCAYKIVDMKQGAKISRMLVWWFDS